MNLRNAPACKCCPSEQYTKRCRWTPGLRRPYWACRYCGVRYSDLGVDRTCSDCADNPRRHRTRCPIV